MNTRHVLMAFAALAILSGLAGAAYNSTVSMVNLTVSPNPVVAGGNATISFQLYNAYQGVLYGASLQPSGSYPILNVSPLAGSVIGPIAQGINSKRYTYTVQIPNTTPSGVYTITFTAEYFIYAATGTETATTQMPVSFFVNNRPDIKVMAENPQPAALYSGYNQTIDIVVQNTGYGTARNVSVDVTGSKGVDVLSSVHSFLISNLTQNASVSKAILISAQNVSQASLAVNVTYYSSRLQNRFDGTQYINLSVAPAAQFTIQSLGQGAKVGATDVPVMFKVTNTGTIAAKQLQLTLQTSYPVTPVSSTAYVGMLQPGESANLTFLVDVDSAGVPSSYPVTLNEQWEQPNGATNQQFYGSTNYFVQVIGSTGYGTATYVAIAAVVAIVIVAAVVYRRRKKGGKRPKG